MTPNDVLRIISSIWPDAAGESAPPPVVREFTRRVLRSGLGPEGFEAACVAHRLEDRYAAKAPDYTALGKRIASKAESVKASGQSLQVEFDASRDAEDAKREADARAGLRRLLAGMDDAELRALLRKGGEEAPHLRDAMRGGEWPMNGTVMEARAAWNKPLTVEVVLEIQHLRVLARRGIGLVI